MRVRTHVIPRNESIEAGRVAVEREHNFVFGGLQLCKASSQCSTTEQQRNKFTWVGFPGVAKIRMLKKLRGYFEDCYRLGPGAVRRGGHTQHDCWPIDKGIHNHNEPSFEGVVILQCGLRSHKVKQYRNL